MLKKISIHELAVGMHVHAVCGAWFDNPYWRNAFFLKDEADIARLRGGRVRQLWIDTSKGIGLSTQTVTPFRTVPANDAHFAATAQRPAPSLQPASTAHELANAAAIIAAATDMLSGMFADVRLGRQLDAQAVLALVDSIHASVVRHGSALASLARLRKADNDCQLHGVAVCAMMIGLARQLGLEENEARLCGVAGLLHDIGKTAVDANAPFPGSPGDARQYGRATEHAMASRQILLQAGIDHPVILDICLNHHERIDGTGYAHGLRGEAVSLHARMAAICDVYDGMTSEGHGRQVWNPASALKKIAEWTRSGQLDVTIFSAFVRCTGIYPLGTLVRMRSGHLAVVTDSESCLYAPVVRAFFCTASRRHIPPFSIDLYESRDNGIASHEDAATWGLGELGHLWT